MMPHPSTPVADFSTTCDKLLVAIHSMVRAINEVTVSNSERRRERTRYRKALDVAESSKGPGTCKCNKAKLRKSASSVSRFKYKVPDI